MPRAAPTGAADSIRGLKGERVSPFLSERSCVAATPQYQSDCCMISFLRTDGIQEDWIVR